MQYTELIQVITAGVKAQADNYPDGRRINMFACVDALNVLAMQNFGVLRPEIESGQAFIRRYFEGGNNDADLMPQYPAALLILDSGQNVQNDQCGKAVTWRCSLFAVDIMRANNAGYFDSEKDRRTKHDIDNDALACLSFIFMHLKQNGVNVVGQIQYKPVEAPLNQDVIRGIQATFSLRLDTVMSYEVDTPQVITTQQPHTITP